MNYPCSVTSANPTHTLSIRILIPVLLDEAANTPLSDRMILPLGQLTLTSMYPFSAAAY
jgi:hypothetical protein